MEKGNCDRKGNAKEWTIIVLRKWVGGIQTNGKRMRENWTGSIRQPNAGSRKVSKWGLENVGKSESWTGKCWESGTGKCRVRQWHPFFSKECSVFFRFFPFFSKERSVLYKRTFRSFCSFPFFPVFSFLSKRTERSFYVLFLPNLTKSWKNEQKKNVKRMLRSF